MAKGFKNAGKWWNDQDIELIEKDGKTYALNGWNGEEYWNCWECTGEFKMDASKEEYRITPVYKENTEGDFDIVDYEVF